MTVEESAEVLLARQSIVNRQGICVGHELLFRGRRVDAAEIDDDFACTLTVVQNMLGMIGVDNVLGEDDGFLNCSSEFLASDIVDILPAQQMVLEILEDTKLDEALARRCRSLRESGFRIALDDVRELTPEIQAFLPYTDLVKIDWPFVGPEMAARIAAASHAAGVKVLAEKVETREDYERAMAIGCDLFQGFYFTRPQLVSGSAPPVNSAALLGVLNLVLHDAQMDDIEGALKAAPSLTVQMLRLANSSTRWRTQLSEIVSIRQALSLVGLKQLARWCCFMLYGADSDSRVDPLAQMVLHRADFMERLARRVAPDDERLQQEAYLSALLSLAHIPQGMDAESFISGIAVSPEIREAIVGYEGWLGALLEVAECVERGEFPTHEKLQALFPGSDAQLSLDGLYL
jgi:EAL and modified HD-GYP domain-containing signal transduction protein